ncbi:MAG TPA: glycine cleavage system aminomethyltransferase GcvT [Clostridia bacterium]|nr:glycine cleavage system aminomethyltransferase GcvT [Clostridia bacterium]HRX41496.1 glycine cleavage system aminomethyltransferase GcvT [Clostridia bacterium]
MKRTPIYNAHVELGARMIDFGGWEMPVQYSGILEEHNKVRNSAGLFDVSHMGEIIIEGNDALLFADYLVTNDLSDMKYGDVIYSPMCYENGGCVDDILVYCFGNDRILLAVNASNTEKDFLWIKESSNGFDVNIHNVSEEYAQLAIQGPDAQRILQGLAKTDLSEIRFFKFRENVMVGGVPSLVSRTGYTGEDGFEIYLAADKGSSIFRMLLEAGGEDILPCGLGARDTLRMESCLPLYGHELSPEITPMQAGLGYFVKITDRPFQGKDVLAIETECGPERKIAGFEMVDRGIARNGYPVFDPEGNEIGYVTSGGFCPSISKNMGLALVESSFADNGTPILIGIRKSMAKAITVRKPFYKKKYKK